jgi:hypothetical protein
MARELRMIDSAFLGVELRCLKSHLLGTIYTGRDFPEVGLEHNFK